LGGYVEGVTSPEGGGFFEAVRFVDHQYGEGAGGLQEVAEPFVVDQHRLCVGFNVLAADPGFRIHGADLALPVDDQAQQANDHDRFARCLDFCGDDCLAT
jgi:hypothetical protein